jgi:hypothetical protein
MKRASPKSVYITNIPKKVRKGYIYLCHNQVRHEADQQLNVNGFRAWWTNELLEGFVVYKCGWSGLPHYRLRQK